MKKLTALIAIGLLLYACSVNIVRGSGRLVTKGRAVRDLNRVTLTGSGDVIVTQGERESLTVETDENVMRHVVTEVRNGTLTLGTKPGVAVSPTRLRFELTVKSLDGLTTTGSGNIRAERLDADELEVEVTGSGNVRVDALTAREAHVRTTGSGNAELAGQVGEQEVRVTGSGDYRGEDLRSGTASVTTTGSGNATVWVTESLDGRITGSGSIRYYGRPVTDVSSSGSGNLRHLGEK